MAYEGGRCLTNLELVDLVYGTSDKDELNLMQIHANTCKICGRKFDKLVFDRNPADPEAQIRKPVIEAWQEDEDEEN